MEEDGEKEESQNRRIRQREKSVYVIFEDFPFIPYTCLFKKIIKKKVTVGGLGWR